MVSLIDTDEEKKISKAWKYVHEDEVTQLYPKLTYSIWTTPAILFNSGAVYFPFSPDDDDRYILNPLKFKVGRCLKEHLYAADFMELCVHPSLSIKTIWDQYTPEFLEKFSTAWFYQEQHDSRNNRLFIFK